MRQGYRVAGGRSPRSSRRGDRLVAHHDPTPRGYANVLSLIRGEAIDPLALSEIVFTADQLLGEPAPPPPAVLS
jgi:hypothetical protein